MEYLDFLSDFIEICANVTDYINNNFEILSAKYDQSIEEYLKVTGLELPELKYNLGYSPVITKT